MSVLTIHKNHTTKVLFFPLLRFNYWMFVEFQKLLRLIHFRLFLYVSLKFEHFLDTKFPVDSLWFQNETLTPKLCVRAARKDNITSLMRVASRESRFKVAIQNVFYFTLRCIKVPWKVLTITSLIHTVGPSSSLRHLHTFIFGCGFSLWVTKNT